MVVAPKACTKCGEEKALEEFGGGGKKVGPSGRRSQCKACCAAYSKGRYGTTGPRYRAYSKKYKDFHWSERLMYSARTASKQRRARGRVCPLTVKRADLEALWVEQSGLCYFTGIPMTFDRYRLDTVSIDRLDPAKGYEPGNVVLATKAANFAKTGHSEEEFRDFLDRVADSIVSRRIQAWKPKSGEMTSP